MKATSSTSRPHECWAHFRLSVIGPLLAAPPDRGQLQVRLQELAAQKWGHPISGQWVLFGRSTLERWYYKALRSKAGPVEALKRKIRSDHGQHPSVSPKLIELLPQQHRQHPSWSYQLHYDNLAVAVEQHSQAGPMPSYVWLLCCMQSPGLFKRARRGPVHSPGVQVAEHRYQAREVRSYESEYVNGLWHLDFHHGSLRVLLTQGRWVYPILLGVLDDHSRLCCHLQWYLAEGARELCHGLCQAFQKRDLPRSLLYDNGSAMIAAETEAGLTRLGVLFENTLPFSPYQNGKQESFWGQVEGRLLPMLEGVADLTLDQLNEVSQPWVELEYNRKIHSEIGQTPLQRFLNNKNVAQPLNGLRDLGVGILTRPQAKVADFYRELGHLFGVPLSPHNRWQCSKLLREKWLAHIETSVFRPVLIIDEAQEMNSVVLSELRLLASADLDSRSILTIILAGDQRLPNRLEEPELLPIASRMRRRLRLEALPPKQLQECLAHLLKSAGNPRLLSPSLTQTLCEHAAGNLRLLMNMANDLLVAASHQEREVIDEKLYFEVFALDPKPAKKS